MRVRSAVRGVGRPSMSIVRQHYRDVHGMGEIGKAANKIVALPGSK
jgi:hypothetical protein